MSNLRSPLRLNVGFIVHQTIGYSRDFFFDLPKVYLPPDLVLNQLSGSARVTRTPQGLLVQVRMHALLQSECVRCLEHFAQPLAVDFTELYAFDARSVTESNLILPEDGRIDLVSLVREYMLLEVPISPLCSSDCKGLCPICGEKLNTGMHNHSESEIDPRLAVLKSLKKTISQQE